MEHESEKHVAELTLVSQQMLKVLHLTSQYMFEYIR